MQINLPRLLCIILLQVFYMIPYKLYNKVIKKINVEYRQIPEISALVKYTLVKRRERE